MKLHLLHITLTVLICFHSIKQSISQSINQPVYWPNFTDAVNAAPLDFDQSIDQGTSCLCDVTFNQCDFNCDCDPNCSSIDRSLFSGSFPETSSQSINQIAICEGDDVLYINDRDLTTAIKDSLLCVVEDNQSIKQSLNGPTSIDQSQFDEYFNEDSTYNFQSTQSNNQSNDQSTLEHYVAFELIKAVYQTNSGYLPVNHQSVSFPSAAFDGSCHFDRSVNQSIRFVQDSFQSCNRISFDLAIDCSPGSALDPNSYVQGFEIATSPSQQSSITITQSDSQSINQLSPCSCQNVLSHLDLLIVYDSGQLISATSTSTLIDLVAQPSNQSHCFPVSFEQSFQVRFLSINQTINQSNNQWTNQTRRKSGTPGYFVGVPLFVGQSVTQSIDQSTQVTAIAQYVDSLQSINQGDCDSTSQATKESIKFGEDLIVSCSRSMSIGQLINQCRSNQRDPFLDSYLIDQSNVYVGIFGDSDLNNIHQWIPINNQSLILPLNQSAMQWDSDTLTCRGLINQLNLEIAVSTIGLLSDPQSVVISARWTQQSNDWKWIKQSINQATRFPITMTVTYLWLPVNDQSINQLSDVEPLFPLLPNDLFYPLWIPNDGHAIKQSIKQSNLILLIGWIVIMWVV